MHYVYVLRSMTDDGFYIGYSANLRKRLWQHWHASSFARSYRAPWKLIYYEAYLEQADAGGRERYLKSGAGRRFVKITAEALPYKTSIKRSRVSEAFYADLHARAQQARNRVRSPLDHV